MKHLRVRTKLLLLLALPILALCFFSYLDLQERWDEFHQAEDLASLEEVAFLLSRSLGELQKERGMTAGLLGSGGKAFSQHIQRQRELTDQNITEFLKYQPRFHQRELVQPVDDQLQQISRLLRSLPQVRQGVDSLEIPLAQATGFYSAVVRQGLKTIHQFGRSAGQPRFINLFLASYHLLSLVEFSGRERALGAEVLARKELVPLSKAKLIAGISLQQEHENQFLQFAGADAAAKMKVIERRFVFREAEDARRKLMEENLQMDPEDWFSLTTRRITGLQELESLLASERSDLVQARLERGKRDLLLVLSFLGLVLLVTLTLASKLVKGILQPLEQAVQTADSIASGNLLVKLEGINPGRDELGHFMTALEQMSQKLHEILSRVGSLTQNVNHTSRSLKDLAHRLSQAGMQQAASIQQMSASISLTSVTAQKAQELDLELTSLVQRGQARLEHCQRALHQARQEGNPPWEQLQEDLQVTTQEMEQLAQQLSKSSATLHEIGSTCQEQDQAARQMNFVISLYAEEAESLANSAQKLNRLAQELEESVGWFKT